MATSSVTADRSILCFGDSNTWGYAPLSGSRFSRSERWTGVLQTLLGSSYGIIEEGLNGRTTVWSEPFRRGRNGLKALPPILESHSPLSLVIIMLGTNDWKHHYHASAYESARGLGALIQTVQRSNAGHAGLAPKLLIVAPPVLGTLSERMALHYEGGLEKSHAAPLAYKQIAEELESPFFDSNSVVSVGSDGVHLDLVGHKTLATSLAPLVVQYSS